MGTLKTLYTVYHEIQKPCVFFLFSAGPSPTQITLTTQMQAKGMNTGLSNLQKNFHFHREVFALCKPSWNKCECGHTTTEKTGKNSGYERELNSQRFRCRPLAVQCSTSELSKPHGSGRIWVSPLCSVDVILGPSICEINVCPAVAME